MAGFEVLQGENEQMFGNATIGDVEDPIVKGKDAPSLYVGYMKTSFDLGDTTVFGGVSYAKGVSRVDHSEDEESPHAFAGDSQLYGADLVILHSFDSYSSLKLQTEWLGRKMDGVQYALDENLSVVGSPDIVKKQAGLYTQLIYAHDRNWKMGLRYDTIYQNDIEKNGVLQENPSDFKKYSAMVEYHTSEFARFRLQYNRNEALYNEEGEQQKIDTIMLQANISIGAHAAHSF